MDILFDISSTLTAQTPLTFKRYLFDRINRDNRLIGINGARGTGKTTLMLQLLKTSDFKAPEAVYVSAEHLYFARHSLLTFADDFVKKGGRMLCIDEIHTYPNWAREVKVIYDSYPKLQVIFSGSSVIDIVRGSADLSRRAVNYTLRGLSFREFLEFGHNIIYGPSAIDDILNHRLPEVETPLKYFDEYLRFGYYPFFREPDHKVRLQGVINKVIEVDLINYLGLKVQTADKLKRLLMHIAEQVPFKPNLAKLADLTNTSQRLLPEYFGYMEKAGLIRLLHTHGKSLRALGKADKVYLDNTNLSYALTDRPNTGSLRETFFANQIEFAGKAELPEGAGDFFLSGITYEIGGKGKSTEQIRHAQNAFIVRDGITSGHGNVLPLWTFGFLY